jgi:prevent-host-death family protein
MKLTDKIKPLSDLKKNTTQILDQKKITQCPEIITKNGQATTVLQDIESYEKTKQALLLLKFIAQPETDIKKGHISSHEKVMERIEKKLAIGKEIRE